MSENVMWSLRCLMLLMESYHAKIKWQLRLIVSEAMRNSTSIHSVRLG